MEPLLNIAQIIFVVFLIYLIDLVHYLREKSLLNDH
jgi:uncharacterized membrane protein YtjA (UPF0391 family)